MKRLKKIWYFFFPWKYVRTDEFGRSIYVNRWTCTVHYYTERR